MSGGRLPSPRPDLVELTGYHSPQLDVRIRLNTNESPYPPPQEFVDDWLEALRAIPLHRYPDRSARELRGGVAARHGVHPEQVFCANGSNEVLQTLLLTYGGADRRALTFEPTYALHSHIARVTATDVASGTRRSDFTIDAVEAAELVAREEPAVIFLCSPNNPSGTVDPPALRDTLLTAAAALAEPAFVVVDEAYGEFASTSALGDVRDDLPLVVVRTYSKVWSLAALRLGFCIAPAPVVERLLATALPYHLSAATQAAGLVALRFEEEMQARVARTCRERDRVVAALGRMEALEVFPTEANFVLVRPRADAGRVWEALVDRGILVRDFSRRPGLEGCLRITIGTDEENDELLAAMAAVVEEAAA